MKDYTDLVITLNNQAIELSDYDYSKARKESRKFKLESSNLSSILIFNLTTNFEREMKLNLKLELDKTPCFTISLMFGPVFEAYFKIFFYNKI